MNREQRGHQGTLEAGRDVCDVGERKVCKQAFS